MNLLLLDDLLKKIEIILDEQTHIPIDSKGLLLNYLAGLYQDDGNWEDSISIYEKILDINQSVDLKQGLSYAAHRRIYVGGLFGGSDQSMVDYNLDAAIELKSGKDQEMHIEIARAWIHLYRNEDKKAFDLLKNAYRKPIEKLTEDREYSTHNKFEYIFSLMEVKKRLHKKNDREKAVKELLFKEHSHFKLRSVYTDNISKSIAQSQQADIARLRSKFSLNGRLGRQLRTVINKVWNK